MHTRSYRITTEQYHSAEFGAKCAEHGVTVRKAEIFYPGVMEFEAAADAEISILEFGNFIDELDDWEL